MKVSEFVEMELDREGNVIFWEVIEGRYLKHVELPIEAAINALETLKAIQANRSYDEPESA